MIEIEVVVFIVACAFLAGLGMTHLLNKLQKAQQQAAENKISPIQVEETAYQQLQEKLRTHQNHVENVLAALNKAQGKLTERTTRVTDIKAEYERRSQQGASESELNEIAARYSRSKAAVSEQQGIVEEAHKVAEEASKTMSEAYDAVREFEQQLDSDKSKADLAELHAFNANARQQAQDIQGVLSRLGDARRNVARKLEEARAAGEMTKGTLVDRERASLSQMEHVASGRAELSSNKAFATGAAPVEIEVIVPAEDKSASHRG